MEPYFQTKNLIQRRIQIIQKMTNSSEIQIRPNLSSIQSLADLIPALKTVEKQLKPQQDIYLFPKIPKENPEDGEILINQDLTPNYTLQVAPSSCEASPLLNGENTDISFKEVYSKFYGPEQIKIQNLSPVGVIPHQFLKPILKSNHPKELLIQSADGEMFKDYIYVNDYFKNLFYFTSKLKNSDYDFKISKIKFIFYQGTKSLIIKFSDYLACQFIYFSLYHKHYIHKEAIGENYKVFFVIDKFFNKKMDKYCILLRNLNSNITQELIEDRFDKLIKKPLKIEGPFIIEQQAHSLIEMQNIEECELACKVFNQLSEKNKITKLNIKANICSNSQRKRQNNHNINIFTPVKMKKNEDIPKQNEQNKDSFYQEKYHMIRQTYCSEDDYQKKKSESKHQTQKKIIYEYEKYEKKQIIIKEKTYVKKVSKDFQRDSVSSDKTFQKHKNNFFSKNDKKSISRSRSRSFSPKYQSKQMKYRKNLQNLQNLMQNQMNNGQNDKYKNNYKPKQKYSIDEKKYRNKHFQHN